jgi:hypothetical protein
MGIGTSLIDAMPQSLGILIYDSFQYFSWWVYLGSTLIYSAFVFSGELSKDGPLIFSKRNARSTKMIIVIHINFLMALLLLMKLVCSIDPSLPDWMTRHIGRGVTSLDLLFIIAMMLMGFIERRTLYVEPDANKHQTDQDS